MGIQVVRDSLNQWLMMNPHPHSKYTSGANMYDRWVVESLVLYLNAILMHGSWTSTIFVQPQPAVIYLARSLGVSL